MNLDSLKQFFLNAFKPKLELSKNAQHRLRHTVCRQFREKHRDGQVHTVTRCRLNMRYLDRSKYPASYRSLRKEFQPQG